LGVRRHVHPARPEAGDAPRLADTRVDVPRRHERERQQTVARVGLDLGHGVVVDLDGQAAQRRVVDHAEVLTPQADGAREDDLRVDAALVEHAESDDGVVRTEMHFVVCPLHQRVVRALLRAVTGDHPAGAEAADGMPVEHPHELALHLLDPRDAVAEGVRGPLGEQVRGLAPVRVGVDDEHILQH
jgi:hypothetical protein